MIEGAGNIKDVALLTETQERIATLENQLKKTQDDYATHVAMVASKERPAYDEQQERIHRLSDELSEASREEELNAALLLKLSDLLARTANEIKGQPPELTQWSHHDLPEMAKELMADNTTVKQDLTVIQESNDAFSNRIIELKAENDRLHELLTIFKAACNPSRLDHQRLKALEDDKT